MVEEDEERGYDAEAERKGLCGVGREEENAVL